MVDEREADLTGRPTGAASPRGERSGTVMAEARPRQRDGDVGMGRVFWCPVSAVQPTEKRSVHTAPPSDSGQGQSVSCSSRPVPPGGHTWDDRPFAEGVAAAHGMSWWWRFSGTNAGVIPASLGVTPHCGGSERVCPGVSRAGRVSWRRRCETGCRSRGIPRSITLRVEEVVDLIIDLLAQPDEIDDATPCRLG